MLTRLTKSIRLTTQQVVGTACAIITLLSHSSGFAHSTPPSCRSAMIPSFQFEPAGRDAPFEVPLSIWDQARSEIGAFTPERMEHASRQLVARVDAILVAYAKRRLSLPQAIQALLRQDVLEGTGAILRQYPNPYRITGAVPRAYLDRYFALSRQNSLVRFYGRGSPGQVRIMVPIFGDAVQRLNRRYSEIHKDLLVTVAEEFYHVAQALLIKEPRIFADPFYITKDRRSLISETARRLNLDDLGIGDHADLLELDVYAKLIEVLGLRNLPREYDRYYAIRRFVHPANND